MDAVEFVSERKRMLENGYIICSPNTPEREVEIVEQWSKEHPVKTELMLFLERYPKADTDDLGSLVICPHAVGIINKTECNGRCQECREKY